MCVSHLPGGEGSEGRAAATDRDDVDRVRSGGEANDTALDPNTRGPPFVRRPVNMYVAHPLLLSFSDGIPHPSHQGVDEVFWAVGGGVNPCAAGALGKRGGGDSQSLVRYVVPIRHAVKE